MHIYKSTLDFFSILLYITAIATPTKTKTLKIPLRNYEKFSISVISIS